MVLLVFGWLGMLDPGLETQAWNRSRLCTEGGCLLAGKADFYIQTSYCPREFVTREGDQTGKGSSDDHGGP